MNFSNFKKYSESAGRGIEYLQSCSIKTENGNHKAEGKVMFNYLGNRSHVHTTQYLDAAFEIARAIGYKQPDSIVKGFVKKGNFDFNINMKEGVLYSYEVESKIRKFKARLIMTLECSFLDDDTNKKNHVDLFIISS